MAVHDDLPDLPRVRIPAPHRRGVGQADRTPIRPRRVDGNDRVDLVQPFFMFIVGAAMPFAFAARRARGGTWANGWPHVLWRAFMLLLLSQIAMIGTGSQWGLQLINVLAQIAFTYVIAYCVLDLRWRAQLFVAFGLLLPRIYVMHAFWPGVGAGGMWAKDANVGAAIDRALLGRTWSGGYATLNFVTSATATIAGVMAANVLRSLVIPTQKIPHPRRPQPSP